MALSSDKDFDPYYQWLGIPPKDQPPNHYRLLGIELYESNSEVIESAADRQMSHIRRYQSGKRGPLTQQLLKELVIAKRCLLDDSSRRQYDESLRADHVVELQPAKPSNTLQIENETPPELAIAKAPPSNPTRATSQNGLPDAASSVARSKMPELPTAPFDKPLVVSSRPRSSLNGQAIALIIGIPAVVILIASIVVVIRVSQTWNAAASQANTETGSTQSPKIQSRSLPPETEGERPSVASDLTVSGDDNQDSNEASSADPSQRMHGAVVHVDRMIPVPFAMANELPGQPDDAQRFRFEPRPKSANLRNGVLEFDVIKGGVVFLVTNTVYEGNNSGGWNRERMTKDDLVAAGWTEVGPCPWKPKETLLRKDVSAGESYRIRTNKYGPPTLIIPKPLAE